MAINLLEEQFRKSQKVRTKNKQQERLLQHELDSRRGMKDIHRYRMEIVNREQKEISKELDRIRMGIKRNLSLAPSWMDDSSDSTKPMRSGASTSQLKSIRSHRTPRHRFSTRSLTSNISQQQSCDEPEVTGDEDDDGDDDDGGGGDDTRPTETPADHEKYEESQTEYDDDDCSSDEQESIPDANILKAIMDGLVGHWEQNVLQTVSNREIERASPRYGPAKSPHSKFPRKAVCERKYFDCYSKQNVNNNNNNNNDSNNNQSLFSSSEERRLSIKSNLHWDDRKNSSVKHHRPEPSSAITEKQTSGKHKVPKLYMDTIKSPVTFQTQSANQSTKSKLTVADHQNMSRGQAVSRGPAKGNNQTQTQSPRRLRRRKEGRKGKANDSMNSRLLGSKHQTLEAPVTSPLDRGQRSRKTTSETLPRLHLGVSGAHSARESVLTNGEHDDIEPTESRRSDGYGLTMKETLQSPESKNLSHVNNHRPYKNLNRNQEDDGYNSRSSSVIGRRYERSWEESTTGRSDDTMQASINDEEQLIHQRNGRRNPRLAANVYKNPKLHVHKDGYRKVK